MTTLELVWREGSPVDLPITQIYGFCLDADGRALVIHDRMKFCLPGGTPEPGETEQETLAREVLEEANTTIEFIRTVGYQLVLNDDLRSGRPYAQLRVLARIRAIGPRRPDPATGRIYGRALCPLPELNHLLRWGEPGEQQIAAALAAARATGASNNRATLEYLDRVAK